MYNEFAYNLGASGSCIRDLAAYGDERAKVVGRENVFDFSIGNPSIPAPKEIGDTVRKLLDEMDSLDLHGYTPAVGSYATRQAIAEDLNCRYDAGIRAEDLFITCGAAPGLTAVFRALATENAELLAVAPFFPEYRPFAEGAGLKFKVVPADVPAFQINLDELDAMLNPNTAAIILNSPNNPSGVVYSEETVKAVCEVLSKKSREYGHAIYLIADEPYRELVYSDVTVPYLMNYYENTLVCYSYSKSLSLPGERIGYIAVSPKMEDGTNIYLAVCGAGRSLGYVCAPSLFQQVIAGCIDAKVNVEAYKENRDILYNNLTAYGYECVKPDGAFYLFVKALEEDSNAFCEKAKEFAISQSYDVSYGARPLKRLIQQEIEDSQEVIEETVAEKWLEEFTPELVRTTSA